MSKAYKVVQRRLTVGENKGKFIYTVIPVSYGLLTTEEAAKQISEESSVTSADVKAVLDRYAYYVSENLRKGYDIELLGFGTLSLRFKKVKGVPTAEEADAKMVESILPAFRPSFKMINGARVYNLVSEKISLVKYNPQDNENAEVGENTEVQPTE